MLPLRARVDLGAMAMKGFYTDKNLSSTTTPGQSEPGSDGNEGLLQIPQNSIITGASPSDCLVSYPGHSLVGRGFTPLQRYSLSILQPQSTGLRKEGVHHIPQNSGITGALTSDCLVSLPGHSLRGRGSYHSVEV